MRIASIVAAVWLFGGDGVPAQAPVLQGTPLTSGCGAVVALTGPPGATFVLAVDTGPGPVMVPGLGTVELDLGPNLSILVNGPQQGAGLDPSGTFTLAVQLPPVPAAPLPLYAQALVAGPSGPVLSNGIAAVIQASGSLVFLDGSAALPPEALLAEDGLFVDVDGDGDDDLLVANSSSATGGFVESRLLVNQGGLQGGMAGVFGDETASRLGGWGVPALAAAAADVDGDGDQDLFLGADDGAYNVPNVLLLNQGGPQGGVPGFFQPMQVFPGGAFETQAACFVDIDLNGDPDLVLGNGTDVQASPAPAELLVNLGGIFVVETAHFGGAAWNVPGETDGVAAADVNGDGWPDLWLARDGQDLLLINGFGIFAPATLPAVSDNSTSVVSADFDLDGDADFLVSNIGQPDRLWVNLGGGTFVAGTLPAAPPGGIHMDADVADVDSDGDADVVVAVHTMGGGERSFIWVNQGGAQGGVPGAFAPWLLANSVPAVVAAVAAGDADGDGDIDLFVASQGFFGPTAQDQLLVNGHCP